MPELIMSDPFYLLQKERTESAQTEYLKTVLTFEFWLFLSVMGRQTFTTVRYWWLTEMIIIKWLKSKFSYTSFVVQQFDEISFSAKFLFFVL